MFSFTLTSEVELKLPELVTVPTKVAVPFRFSAMDGEEKLLNRIGPVMIRPEAVLPVHGRDASASAKACDALS